MFAYDANGNLKASGTLALTYDVEIRLTAASGDNTVALSYDPLDRLPPFAGWTGTA